MSCVQDLQVDLDLGELDLTSQDEFILDEVDGEYITTYISREKTFNKISLWKFILRKVANGTSLCILVHIQENLEDELVKEALEKVSKMPSFLFFL